MARESVVRAIRLHVVSAAGTCREMEMGNINEPKRDVFLVHGPIRFRR
jgi:hypothetical protein